jgi:cell division protein FtsB
MPRRTDARAPDATDRPARAGQPDPSAPIDAPDDGATARPDLSAIPVAGITPRRLASILGALVAIWIVIVFARQAGAATDASARVAELEVSNTQLAADVVALEAELRLIQRPAYISQQARGYALGKAKEVPFRLAPDAPPLAPDAPGSAAARLGEAAPRISPLESWLSLLFGPGR